MKSIFTLLRSVAFTLITMLLFTAIFSQQVQAQSCTFVSPTVELVSSQTDTNGNCQILMNLSFTISHNNGNKWTVVHLWQANQYNTANHTYNNTPTVGNGGLTNAILTVVIDINNAVLASTYVPDPSINNTILKDAADGLGLIVTPLPNNNYFYQITNVPISIPGACNNLIAFQGDAWSTNGQSVGQVQCAMTGISFLSNVPTLTPDLLCTLAPDSNEFSFQVAVAAPGYSIDYNVTVYADVDSNSDFNPLIDSVVVGAYTNGELPDITSSSPYSHPNTPYAYSATVPNKYKDLFFLVGNIIVTNNNVTPALVTNYSNTILTALENDCFQVLPVKFGNVRAYADGSQAIVQWEAYSEKDIIQYEIEYSTDGKSFTPVALQSARNSGKLMEEYQSPVTLRTANKHFFRIAALENNGAKSYSPVISLNTNTSGSNTITTYPNPSNGQLSVHINVNDAQEKATLSIKGLDGKMYMNKQVSLKKGTTVIELSEHTKHLPAGVYMIHLNGAQDILSHKLLIH